MCGSSLYNEDLENGEADWGVERVLRTMVIPVQDKDHDDLGAVGDPQQSESSSELSSSESHSPPPVKRPKRPAMY